MKKLLGPALTLLLVGVTAARTADPPHGPLTLGSVPILSIREVEEPCGPSCILAPATCPEKRPGVVLLRVFVDLPFTECVYVPRTTKQKRLVYRTVSSQVPCTQQVFVPEPRVKKVRMVYRPHEELRPRKVLVPTVRQELCLRQVYRPVSRPAPCTRDVYVPVVTREKKVRLVYVTERVPITRTVPTIRMQSVPVSDPATGKTIIVQKPVCEQRQVTETHSRISLCPREVEETVTNYRLERRTEMRTKVEYELTCRMVSENVTTYHLETRMVPERVYCLEPALVEETVTRYHLECRTEMRTVNHYIPEWREEDVTTYHLETRCGVRPVEQVIVCKGEIIVPVTRMQTLSWPQTRKRFVAEPLAIVAPGCVTASGGGFAAACGSMSHAPVLGR